MARVGIIANPSAGKDIRRLISQSRFVSNQEKVNIVRRVIKGLSGVGIEEVVLMPDYGRISQEAASTVGDEITVSFLEMPIFNSELEVNIRFEILIKKIFKSYFDFSIYN